MRRAPGKLCPKTLTIMILAGLLAVTFTAYAVQASEPRPAMVVDEEAGIIRFFIDGEEKASLDATGLHVNGSITYSGTVRDIGNIPLGEPEGGRDADE